MVNYSDPAVILTDYLAMVKMWHAVGGLYIWEFFTTLEYEWNVIRGRLPYRWTILVYSLARLGALFSVTLRFVLMDNRIPVNCQVIFSFMIVFSYSSVSASSLLIVLRTIAIWNRNRVIVVMSITIWVVNAAFLIQGAARLRAAWSPATKTCVSLHTSESILTLVNLLVTDFALLLIMLFGLLRVRYGGAYGLTELLWKQGVLWLLLATMAEVPPVVLIGLNLNGPFNIMFQPPSWITMAIAATRMHRSLVDYAFGSSENFSASSTRKPQQQGTLTAPKIRRIRTASASPDQMGVTVHVVAEQHVSQHMSSNDSCIDIDVFEEVKRDTELTKSV